MITLTTVGNPQKVFFVYFITLHLWLIFKFQLVCKMYQIITKYDFIMSERTQRNEFGNYLLYVNFTDHYSALSQG